MQEDFFEKYSKLNYIQPTSIGDPNARMKSQPNSIHICDIKDQSITFIEVGNFDRTLFSNNYLRIDKIVIPQDAYMVNVDFVKNNIVESSKEPVRVEKASLLSRKFSKSVLLNICGMFKSSKPHQISFHACDDYEEIGRGSFTCDLPLLSTSFPIGTSMQPKYKLIMFYIFKEDILNETIPPKSNDEKVDQYVSIKKRLKTYFGSELVWSKLDGVFLVPRLMSDQSVKYLCLLNMDTSLGNHKVPSIQSALSQWFNCVEGLNLDPTGMEMIIKGRDQDFCGIDQWSVLVGKDAVPETISIEKLYKKED